MNRDRIGSTFILRSPRLRAGEDARAVVAEAQELAKRIVEDAEAVSARLRADAEVETRNKAEDVFTEARARGLGEAAAEAALLIAQTAEAIDCFWREREDELRDVALAVAHRVLAALPRDEILLRLATEAIAEHGRDTRLALKTSPDMADHLRAALSTLEFGDHVTVSPDPSLEPGGCTLLHPQGRTEIGLVAQFRSMLAAGGGRG